MKPNSQMEVSEMKGQRQEEEPDIAYCTVLYCTILYCTVLYCTVLYCTVLYCTVLYCTVLLQMNSISLYNAF